MAEAQLGPERPKILTLCHEYSRPDVAAAPLRWGATSALDRARTLGRRVIPLALWGRLKTFTQWARGAKP
jgi:hypothetical protein